MLRLVVEEFAALDLPARQGAGRFTDVGFAKVADAERKQFHQFAGIVFIRHALLALHRVEPDHHRRVFRHPVQQLAEIAEHVAIDQVVLIHHVTGIEHFGVAGGEMIMPEQGQLFPERMRRIRHSIQPPFRRLRPVVDLADRAAPPKRFLLEFHKAGAPFKQPVDQLIDRALDQRPPGSARILAPP